MSEPNLTLKESIDKALTDEFEKTEPDEKEESNSEADKSTSKDDVKDESDEDEKDEKEIKEESISEEPDAESEEILTALNLLRSLRDPEKSNDLIKNLAIRAGIIKENQDLTAKDEKDLKDIITEELASEYPDLTDKITKILKASEAKSEAKLKALRDEIALEKASRAEKEFTNEFSSFITNNKIDEKAAAQMLAEIKMLPPSGNITLTNYLSKIYRLVNSNDSDKSKTKKETLDEAEKNRRREKNASEKVKNLSSEVGDDRIKAGSRLPTAREAIMAAMNGEKIE